MKKTYTEFMTKLEKIKEIKQEKKAKLAKRISMSIVATCLVVATTFGVQNSSKLFNLTGKEASETSAITADVGDNAQDVANGTNGENNASGVDVLSETEETSTEYTYLQFVDRQKYIKMGETAETVITTDAGIKYGGNITYKSSNEDIATVDENGRITGKARGEVTIVAENENGDTARCIVYIISNKPDAITLPDAMTMGYLDDRLYSSIILKEDGTVWSVGANGSGQLGRGTFGGTSLELQQVKISETEYLTDVVKITGTSGYNMLALTKNGEVYAWGFGGCYTLGQGTDNTGKAYATKIPNLHDIIDIDQVLMHCAKALTKDGEVYTWGGTTGYSMVIGDTFGVSGTPTKLRTINNVVDISSGYLYFMYLKGDGTVWGNGEGDYGKLGYGSTSDQRVPVQVRTSTGVLNNIVQINAVDEMGTAVDIDGNYYAWGKNSNYQLGNGGSSYLRLATKIAIPEGEEILETGGGNDFIAILTKSGKIYVSGYNGYGQLSQGNTTRITMWTLAKAQDRSDFTNTFRISKSEKDTLLAIKKDGSIWSSGQNNCGQLGLGDTTNRTYLTQIGFAEFSPKQYEQKIKPNESINLTKDSFDYSGEFNVFVDGGKEIENLEYESQNMEIAVVDESGKVTGITEGQTKIKVTNTANGDVTYVLIKVSENEIEPMLTGGVLHSLALKSNGTVWSFGSNQGGQLGNINYEGKNVTKPIEVLKEDGTQLSNIQKIAAGYEHSIALTESGEVYTWGANSNGQLGNGTKVNSGVPTKVELETKVVDICGWMYRTVVLDENGEVYVWGKGYTANPQKLEINKKVIGISGNLILTEDKKVYTMNNLTSPVGGLSNVVKVLTDSSDRTHYMALTSDGKIYSWGTTSAGEAGNGTTGTNNTPTFVKTPDGTGVLTGIVDVNVIRISVMALDDTGKVYTWGSNLEGKLGIGSTTSKSLPVEINYLPEIEKIITYGVHHNLVMDTEGYVWGAGWNENGQLGNGTLVNSSTFTKIGDAFVSANKTSLSMHIGEQEEVVGTAQNSFNLKKDEIATELTYHIVDENIASYEDGKVIAKAVGTTYLVIESDELDRCTAVKIEVLPDGGVAVPDLQAGLDFEVALKADGSVWTWGTNTYGQLGNGTTVASNEPEKVEEIEAVVKDISTMDNHSLALTEEGKVYSFGYNGYGQCGNGTATNVTTPVTVKTLENKKAVELTNIVKVKAGKNVSYAIDNEFNLWAWGQGYGKYAVKVTKVENVIDVTTNYVLTAEGKVYNLSNMEQVLTVQRVKALEEGHDHIVMLAENNTAYAIGNNTYGQLGTGNNIDSTNAVVGIRDSENVGLLGNIKDIRAGNGNTIAITNDGTVYIWGLNDAGKSGVSTGTTGENTNSNLPVEFTKVLNASIVELGYNHTSISDTDGFVWNFGKGELGQLGNRENVDSKEPVMVGTYEITASANSMTLRVHESKNINAKIDYFNLIKDGEEGIEYTSYNDMVATVDQNGNIEGIATGNTSIEIKQEGLDNKLIIPVEVLDADQIAKPDVETNGSHTIILKANGTVWSYGTNTYGELGNGTNEESDSPVQVEFGTGTQIVEISAGTEHNIALDTNGTVWTWGRNNYGQLGVTGLTSSNVPVQVTIPETVVKVVAGNNFSFVIGESGKVYAFGYNVNGELGVGTYKNVTKPTEVLGVENAIDIAGAENHSVLVTNKGEIYTTGNNTYGQLGTEETRTNKFTKVAGISNIIEVETGDNHNVALSIGGDVYVWGSNIYGQLGLNDRTNRNVPTKVEDIRNIEDISAGRANTMLLENTGVIYSTGANTEGEIGDGTVETKEKYVEVTRIPDAIEVTTGNTYSVAIRKDGTVWGWGDYNHGVANKESKTNSEIPVIIGNDASILNGNKIILKTSEIRNLGINTKYQFNVYEEYDKEADDFTYESANPGIAEINEDGIIMGVKVGVTKVTAIDKETKEEYTVIVKVIDNQKLVIPKVEGGNGFAVALKGDGTIWTWGYNSSGALGDGTYGTALVPKKTNIIATYTDISVGKDFGVALRNNGTVWAWGSNSNGQLGIENHQNSAKPVQVHELENIEQIATGETHAVAISGYGIIYGWGSNQNGELGLYSQDDVVLPTVIATPDTEVVSISAGKGQTSYVTTEGKVYGLGSILSGELEGIDNAIKVEVGEGYILILTKDGEIYEYDGNLSQVIGASNAINISAQGQTRMYQNIAGEVFVWGTNTEGQLGTNDIADKTTPTKVAEYGKNAFGIGAGYDNTYIIANDGFVYASGKNNYGQLGNSTQEPSLVHTLVGDREFELVPDNKIMTVNDVEDIEIDSNTFNVFNDAKKDKTQYTWESTDETIVEITEDGVLTAKAIGTATIKATDKITNEQKEAIRVVMPIDEQRIASITVDGEQASIVGDKAYSVIVRTDENIADLRITTNDITDKISIDEGVSYTNNGVLSQEIDITEKTTNIPIRIKTANGTEIDYTLEIIKESKNVNLESLTVNGIEATARSTTDYEMIVEEDVDLLEIVATAEHDLAKVRIDGEAYQDKQAMLEKEMEGITAVIPIEVQSEGGLVGTYMLIVYKKSALVDIADITVNGKAAIRTSETEFNAVIEREADLSVVTANATYELANVAIGSNEATVQTAISSVETTEEATKVHISVTTRIENETGAEVYTREYVLTIYKARINAKIDILTVNGTTIIPTGNRYEAYVANNTDEAEVRVVTALDTDKVQIADQEEGIHDVTRAVATTEDENIYTIVVTDGETAETQEYELIIRKPSTDTSIISITGENEDYEREAELVENEEGTGDTENSTYELKVPQGTEEITLRVTTGSKTARISINGGEFQDGGEASEVITLRDETATGTDDTIVENTRAISTTNSRETTVTNNIRTTTNGTTNTTNANIIKTVPVIVEAENGTTKEYTVNIVELNDDNTLKELTVNGVEATKSDTEENTYNFTLTEALDEVTVRAVTNSETASLYIVNGEYIMQEAEKTVAMDSKVVRVEIAVKAESGLVERYYLNIEGLSDNTNATYTVDGEEGTFVAEESKYIFRVDSSKTNHTVLVETEDSNAKVQLADQAETTGTASMQLTNDDIGKQYSVTITAQDGTKETVTIELQEKETDAEIAYLTVNEEILEPDASGNYSIAVKHNVDIADIFVKLNSNYATVALEGIPEQLPEVEEGTGTEDGTETGNTDTSEESGSTGTGETIGEETGNDDTTGEEQETIPANQPTTGLGELGYKLLLEQEGSITLIIRVTAENGTEKTHTLTITKLNGNTNLSSIIVDGVTVTANEEGEYEYVIARKDTAEVVATAENAKSSVKIDEGEAVLGKASQTATLADETTIVVITVIAEDGTEESYQLHIRKLSNDNILESITAEGVDEDNIQATGETSFEIKVPITQESVNITAVARSEYASLKLDGEEDTAYNTKGMTRTIELPENQTDITIVVKAENGDLKNYTVSIVKINSLDIENVAVDDETIELSEEEDAYIGWYNADGNANVKISTVDKTTKIELIQNDQIIATETGDLNVDLSNLDGEVALRFRVTLQDGSDYEMHNIILNKKSTDNSIEFVKIDDVEILQENGGYDKVLDRKDTYTLDIKTTNEYAQIKIDNGEYVQGELITQINMANIEEKEITITVKSQNGEEQTYPLHIRKISNDTSLKLVTVDDENAEKVEENYHAFIERNANSVAVKAEAASEYANVVIEAGDSTTENNSTTAELEVATPDEITEVTIKVTAENGKEKTYTLEIEKESQDVSIAEITVNNEATELGEDGVYRANVVDTLENANVYVKTTNPYANIKINGIESEINGENTQTVPLNPDEKVQTVEIEVTAQDGTIQNYTLEITRLNDDNSLEYVKANGVEIVSENGSLYDGIIDATSSSAEIEIKANNVNTELVYVPAGEGTTEQTGKGILTIQVPTVNDITELTFDAISENGSKKTYTIRLTKKSNDNSIMQILVNNTEAVKTADGNYIVDVLDTVNTANIRVTTTNEKATVRINSEEETVHVANASLALEEKVTVVTITTTSETGIQLQTTLTITKKSDNCNVQIVTVDEKEVTNYNERTHTYTATANIPKNGYNVTIMAENSEAQVTLGEDTAKGTLRTFVAVEGEGKEVTFTVTAENGTQQEYKLVIIKASDNVNVSIVELNDVEILPVDEENGIYREIIPKFATSVKVRVKAEDTYAEVRIGDAEAEYNESIVNVPIDINDEEVTIPVVVTAADGETIKTYNIVLVRGNNNTNITEVQVEGERIGYENGKYSASVEGGLAEARVTITLADPNATVSLNGEVGKGKLTVNVPLEGIQTITEIEVTAEDGTKAKYPLEINKHVSIEGKIITENTEDKHIALVQIFKSTDSQEVIAESLTNEDGTFDIMVPEVDTYNVVITKPGYIDYTVTDIETLEGESSDIGEKELIAGDIVKSGQIEIDDLVAIADNYGMVQELEGTIEVTDGDITETQEVKDFVKNGLIEGKTAEEILQKINEGQSGTETTVTIEEIRTFAKQIVFDLNEDGVIDSKDRAIIKANYDKVNVEEVWVNPELAQNGINLLSVDAQNNALSGEEAFESANNVENQEKNGVLSGDNTQGSSKTESVDKAQDKSTQTPNERGFIKPMDCEYEITSEYGYRIHPITGEESKHTGIDISGEHHTNIYAVADGEVTYAGVQSGYGNCIEIKHTLDDGTVVYSFYAHLSKIDIEVGEKVSVGDKMGLEGGDPETDENAGSSTGHHLHFEIRTESGYGYDINPEEYVEI